MHHTTQTMAPAKDGAGLNHSTGTVIRYDENKWLLNVK